ncbi:MAG: EF-hand domain-containing protein [Phycisphaerae bacterium]|nr:EF-hand domain-containing protein [Phycisphaerae bacterium]
MVSGISGGPKGIDMSAMWQDLIKRADKDGDGKVSKEEMLASMPQDGGASPMKVFEKADADGDGKISKADFKAALPAGTDSATANKVFDSMDTNQDGVVDAQEYLAAMQKTGLMTQVFPQESFSALA